MIEISMTDFVDFVSSPGLSRIREVGELKKRPDYHPKRDYYKGVRNAIKDAHQNNGGEVDVHALFSHLSESKRKNYEAVVSGHQRFVGNRDMEFFEPPHNRWQHDELSIRINPELGLIICEKPHVIKVHFKAEELSAAKAGLITHALETSLRRKAGKQAVMGVLDARRGKLYTPSAPVLGVDALLIAEAVAFLYLWKQL